jgi:signal transduction histidine kinase
VRLIKAQANKLDAAAQSALAETEVLLQQVNSEIRTISHLLHPPLLEDLGLLPALRSYVAGFSDRSHIKTDLQIPSEFDRLPGGMEIAVFRIVQECLTNIHRHSRATRAKIIIHYQGQGVVVQVHDNGCGISRNQLAKLTASGTAGVGLTGIEERVRQLNGTLEIKSDKTGTAVIASLPLTRSNAAAG